MEAKEMMKNLELKVYEYNIHMKTLIDEVKKDIENEEQRNELQ